MGGYGTPPKGYQFAHPILPHQGYATHIIERKPLRGIWRGAMHFAIERKPSIERKPLRGIWRDVMLFAIERKPLRGIFLHIQYYPVGVFVQ